MQQFADQFAFRPTGSTTAALIYLLHQISVLLQDNDFVHLIALDFSKAFDSVRHHTLLHKFAEFPLPNFLHNWLADYFSNRSHCTKFNGLISDITTINASIIQGSGIGPIAYVFNASDLKPLHTVNKIGKYADDTYLLVGSKNSNSIQSELCSIDEWAASNNLKLNTLKSLEMIIRKPRSRKIITTPALTPGIERASSMNILGVTLSDVLTFNEHVGHCVARGMQSIYALRLLRSHGLVGEKLHEVARATLIAQLVYASPSWWGFLDSESKIRIQSFLNKTVRQGFLPSTFPTFAELCTIADDKLFSSIQSDENHVLHQLLPPIKTTGHDLRSRIHNYTIPNCKDTLLRKNYINRMLYKGTY